MGPTCVLGFIGHEIAYDARYKLIWSVYLPPFIFCLLPFLDKIPTLVHLKKVVE